MPKLLEERLQVGMKPLTQEERYALCGKCGCSWFEEVKLARVNRNQVVVPGQSVPKLSEQYIVIRCGKCNELHEPSVFSSHSAGYKMHQTMITELDKKTSEDN